MIKKFLEDAANSKELVCLYTHPDDTQSFICGYVSGLDGERVLILSVSPGGGYDGYAVKNTGDIYFAESANMYTRKIEKLMSAQNTSWREIPRVYDNILDNLSEFAKNNRLVVSLELNASGNFDVRGFVCDFDSDSLKIATVNEYGVSDGFAVCSKKAITSASCDDEEEQRTALLSRM